MFTNRTLNRLDQMLDEAISGDFKESDYDESKLSRLESKWKQYLGSSALAKENLEKEKENVKSLVSDISHQTKTPMTNIKMYAQLLDENLESGNTEMNRKLLQEILTQTEKLEFLIQSLTKMSRLESNIFELKPVSQPVTRLLDEVIGSVERKAEKKNICIIRKYGEEFKKQSYETVIQRKCSCLTEQYEDEENASEYENGKYKPAEPEACYDLKWTKEALENILDNAVKYSPAGSAVVVSIIEYELYTAISVKDEGIGIPEEEIPKIFARFYRGTWVQQEDGVGIGLYLARMILRMQNGYIKVKSTLGHGSEFLIYLQKGNYSEDAIHKMPE